MMDGRRRVYLEDLKLTALDARIEADLEKAWRKDCVTIGWVEVRVSTDEWASGYTWWWSDPGVKPPVVVLTSYNKPLLVTRYQPIWERCPQEGVTEWVKIGPDIFDAGGES